VAGIDVAHGSQLFVVTAQKGCAGTHSFRSAADALIQLLAELHHRIRFVDLIIRQASRPFRLKRFSRRHNNRTILGVVSSDIEQAEDNALWIRARELVEVATYPMTVHPTRNFGTCELGQLGNARTSGWSFRSFE
jgi:hypothetical protein